MRRARYIAVIFFLAAVSPCREARGEPPVGPPQWMVRADVRMVSISPAQALTLVPRLTDPRNVNAACARLQTMIAHGEAELIAWPVVCTRSGERGAAESAEEFKYPTESTPPHPPQDVPAQNFRTFDLPDIRVMDVPDAFEVRNLGPSLEIEPLVSADGRHISVTVSAHIVRLLRMRHFRFEKWPSGLESSVHQPEFATSQVTTSLDLESGHTTLLGSFIVPHPKPHVELFILHATATAAGSGKPQISNP